MKVKHVFGGLSAEKAVNEDVGFMLTNKNGSYAFLRQAPTSRYEGVFFFDSGNMYKAIENINVVGAGEITGITNGLYFAERERKSLTERFLMPKNFCSLVYELSKEAEIELFLDCKDSYDNMEFGRYYNIFEEKKCIVVRFTKRAEGNESGIMGVEQYTLYLAIRTDGFNYKKISSWIERHYLFDEKRNSKPYYRHVFHALNIKGKNFVFSMGREKGRAIEEANHLFEKLSTVKENEEKEFCKTFIGNDAIKKMVKTKRAGNEVKIAYICALNSLYSLAVNSGKTGILAGLPWFFQFWSRDEAVSLKSLSAIDPGLAKKIIIQRLGDIQADGRLPNIYYSGSSAANADSVGWLFSRAFALYSGIKANLEALEQLKQSISKIKGRKIRHKKIIMLVNRVEKALESKERENKCLLNKKLDGIKKCAEQLAKNYSKDGLIYNNRKETWMDTEFSSNGREGFNIEIQALALALYRCAFIATNDAKYKMMENNLKKKVLEKFSGHGILADNLQDTAIRPNVFVAHYVYQDLLPKTGWEKCFDGLLEDLWLGFGGLSTIDKKNPSFAKAHTGESAKSYHSGDSWFWINNLAAIALFTVNKNKFKSNIAKILSASTEEILWKGIIGAHSELSSAESLRPEGCLNQAWSNAMFAELVGNVFNIFSKT